MGADNSKHAASTLSDKDLARLRSKIVKEYPWLLKVEESMLITDCRKPDSPIVFANNDFHGMTQYTKEEVLGHNCRFLQGRHTNPKTVAKVRAAIANGEELEVEILNYRKDGTPFLNNFALVPLHTKGGKTVTHFLAIQKDVTYLLEESDPAKWRPSQIALWLERAGFEEYAMPFIENEVDGRAFMDITMDRLRELGLVDPSIRRKIVKLSQMLASHGPGVVFMLGSHSSSMERTAHSETAGTENAFFDERSAGYGSEEDKEESDSALDLSEDSQDAQDADLVQPSAAAFQRRKKHNAKSSRGSERAAEPAPAPAKDAGPQIELKCTLFNLESEAQSAEQLVLIRSVDLLYHVKLAIKQQMDIPTAIDIKIRVDGEWKKANSQAVYRELMDLATVDAPSVEVMVVETAQEMFANMFGLNNFKESVKDDAGAIAALKQEFSRDESALSYTFLISQAEWGNRAMIFDTLFSNADSAVHIASVGSVWDTLIKLKREREACFVVPCSGTGALPEAEFPYKAECQAILEGLMVRNMGEVPLGTTMIRRAGDNYVVLCVMATSSLSKDKSSHQSYYSLFRALLVAIDEHNNLVKAGSQVRILDITSGQPAEAEAGRISNVFFPVYTTARTRKTPETMKLGHQVSVALDSFHRWQYCQRKKRDAVEAYRVSAPLHEKKLRAGVKGILRNKEDTFLAYLTSGTLANRGLMDQQEIGWLVECCGFEAPVRSKFSHDRRLQRLGNVALGALLNNKRYATGPEFQASLRHAITHNPHCLAWVLKMACAGSMTVCPSVSLESLGKLIRFARGHSCSLFKTVMDGEEVTTKLYNEEKDQAAVLHEVSLLSLLEHPNVLCVKAWGVCHTEDTARRMFSVMQYAQRGSLFTQLRNKPEDLEWSTRYNILVQTAGALQYLHSLGMQHKDLSTRNILLCEDWSVLVSGAGNVPGEDEVKTDDREAPIWTAPEVFARNPSTKSDIYSLGMVMYEMLTDTVPFEKHSTYEIPNLVTKGTRPAFKSTANPAWVKLVQSMWHDKPTKRPLIEDVINQLDALKGTEFST